MKSTSNSQGATGKGPWSRTDPSRLLGTGLVVMALIALVWGTSLPAKAASEFERIREKAEEMVIAVNETEMKTYDEGKDSELERTYGGYQYLLTPSKLERLSELVAEPTDPAERKLREASAAVIRYHAIQSNVAAVMDNCRNSMYENTVAVDGKTLRLRGLDHQVGLIENRDQRRGAYLAASRLYTGINVYLRSLMLDLNDEARELDYEGYYPFLQEVQGWDLDLMTATAETVLEGTQTQYQSLMTTWTERELDLDLDKLRSYDAMRLFFFPELSEGVKDFEPFKLLEDGLAPMGLRIDKQRTLRTEAKDRDGRVPTADVYPIQAGKAEVAMIPSEMVSDVQDALGAIGEAEFHYLISGDTPYEEAYFGNNVYPSAYRALFELLAEEPAWIEENLELKGVTAEEVAEALRLRRIYHLREAAGQYLFQLKLHENPQIDSDLYNEQMEAAVGWKHIRNDADAYMLSNDDYASGGRLLGWAMALQIRDALRAKNGEQWWDDESIMTKLEQGARRGYAPTTDEFLSVWGVTSLDTSVLVAEL